MDTRSHISWTQPYQIMADAKISQGLEQENYLSAHK